MKKQGYLLDTHTLIFWIIKTSISDEFVQFLDEQNRQGRLYVSSISFWEAALLAKKGRIEIQDVELWKDEILAYTSCILIEPTVSEMIASTKLPDFHKDPFDRLLIVQANHRNAFIVTKDTNIHQYDVPVYWKDYGEAK
jgi:PIN domain nuclease of toxin-antitoxin system